MNKWISSAMLMSVFVVLLFGSPHYAHAAWTNDPAVNTPIATNSGSDFNPAIVSDSHGGAIIAWQKGFGTIYAQRVDATGDILWTLNGVDISSWGDSRTPQIAGDGAGGAIITWFVYETGIYAQRVDSNGNLLWDTSGVTISEADEFVGVPNIVSDNAGGAIIAWVDHRAGDYRVYAQRINSFGAVQWVSDGISVSGLTRAYSGMPGMISDGGNGAIITWSDYVIGDSNSDIYAQKIDGVGSVKWGGDGMVVCAAAGNQTDPQIVSDGSGGAILTWRDQRTPANSIDIYAQRIDAAGNAKWTADGVAVCTTAGEEDPLMASDGHGGAFIAWMEFRNSAKSIYTQRLDSNGNTKWTSNGIALTNSNASQFNIMGDRDTAVIAWRDAVQQELFHAQKIDINSNEQWATGGVAFRTAPTYGTDIQLVADGSGGTIFTWYDSRNFSDTGYDIYAQKVQSNGTLPCADYPVRIQETTSHYPTIQAAYNAANGQTVQMESIEFTEDLSLNSGHIVKLQGGYYGCDYSSISGFTTVHGKVTIGSGTVTIASLIIQ